MFQAGINKLGLALLAAMFCFVGGCTSSRFAGWCPSCCSCRSLAIPESYPLGSVVRAHYHTMQTNAEAADFIIHRHEWVGSTAELTPYGRDHLPEIAARARNAPFPVLIERTEHNSDPELDALRRGKIVQVLVSMGVPEAEQRTIVSQSYGNGYNSLEAEFDYYLRLQRGFNQGGGGLNNGANGFGGGFGGGGFTQ